MAPGSPSLEPLREGAVREAVGGRGEEWGGELVVEEGRVEGSFMGGQREGRCRVTPESGRIAWIHGNYKRDRFGCQDYHHDLADQVGRQSQGDVQGWGDHGRLFQGRGPPWVC